MSESHAIVLCAQCGSHFECRVLTGDRLVMPASLRWAERERWKGFGVVVERVPLCIVCREQHRRADSWKDGTLDVGFAPP